MNDGDYSSFDANRLLAKPANEDVFTFYNFANCIVGIIFLMYWSEQIHQLIED